MVCCPVYCHCRDRPGRNPSRGDRPVSLFDEQCRGSDTFVGQAAQRRLNPVVVFKRCLFENKFIKEMNILILHLTLFSGF